MYRLLLLLQVLMLPQRHLPRVASCCTRRQHSMAALAAGCCCRCSCPGLHSRFLLAHVLAAHPLPHQLPRATRLLLLRPLLLLPLLLGP